MAVYKRVIILLSFLAYSLSMAHSLVPHRHDGKAKVHHHHHHHDNENDHHHHNEEDQEDKSLSDAFAAAIHHPASGLIIRNPESQHIQKSSSAVDLFIAKIGEIIFVRRKPPAPLTNYQQKHYSFRQDSFFLLRAPPVA